MPSFKRFTAILATFAVANWIRVAAAVHQTVDSNEFVLYESNEFVLYEEEVMYESGESESTWCVDIDDELVCNIEGISQESIKSLHPVSGQTIMKTQGAYLKQLSNPSELQLVHGNETSISFENISEGDARYHGQSNTGPGEPFGNKTALVIRVTDSTGKEPTVKSDKVKNAAFHDPICLRSLFEDCSKNQMTIQPYENGNGGVIELTLHTHINGSELHLIAFHVRRLMIIHYPTEYDNVDLFLVCIPHGAVGERGEFWNSYVHPHYPQWSVYNDNSCTSAYTMMHEVGHAFGLKHSSLYGATGDLLEFGDSIGQMGIRRSRKCFNAPKNYQLGWYTNQQADVDPLDFVGSSRIYIFNGIEQYHKVGSANKLIVLKLLNQNENDYFIGYNEAVGAHAGTDGAINKVTVHQAGQEWGGNSILVADLVEGDVHVINNFRSSEYNVYIKVVSIVGADATVEVITTTPPPSPRPTPSPTPVPTPIPTSLSPSPLPTPKPTTPEPSSAVTSPPTIFCQDNENIFQIRRKKKSCKKWLSKFASPLSIRNKRKIRTRCRKRYMGKPVYDYCQATCALVKLGPCAFSAASA